MPTVDEALVVRLPSAPLPLLSPVWACATLANRSAGKMEAPASTLAHEHHRDVSRLYLLLQILAAYE